MSTKRQNQRNRPSYQSRDANVLGARCWSNLLRMSFSIFPCDMYFLNSFMFQSNLSLRETDKDRERERSQGRKRGERGRERERERHFWHNTLISWAKFNFVCFMQKKKKGSSDFCWFPLEGETSLMGASAVLTTATGLTELASCIYLMWTCHTNYLSAM